MGHLFSYAIASSLLLCLGYLSYKWIMAGERQHACNRMTLYLIYILALTLPALDGIWGSITIPSTQHHEVEIEMISGGLILQSPDIETPSEPLLPIILIAIYLAGVILTLAYTLYGVWQIINVIRHGEKIKTGRFTLVITDREDIAPFSWLSYYVINRGDYANDGNVIAVHETAHLRHRHWIDLAVAQIVEILLWFNPAAWLMAEEMKTVHEYQADEAVLASGADMRQYQSFLIKKAVGMRFQVLANSLNHSKLKKRVTMMYKSKSSKSRRLGALMLLPAMGIGCSLIGIPAVAAVLDSASSVSLFEQDNSKVSDFSSNQNDKKEKSVNVSEERMFKAYISEPDDSEANSSNPDSGFSDSGTFTPDSKESDSKASLSENTASAGVSASPEDKKDVYVRVEKMAEFPGGVPAMMQWLGQNIKYPEKAIKENIQGRVVVKMVVEKDGKIGDVTVMKGVDPDLDKEAVKVVKAMPKWIPAETGGKPVASYYSLPVSFKLTSDSPATENNDSTSSK